MRQLNAAGRMISFCPKHGWPRGGMHVCPDLAKFIREGGERPAFRQMKYTLSGEEDAQALGPPGTFPWEVLVSQAFAEARHLPKTDVVLCASEEHPPWYDELKIVCVKCIEERGITLR